MTDIRKLVAKYTLVSDQVSQREVEIVLAELDKVLGSGVAGDVVEFGCYKGTTSLFLSRLLRERDSDKKLWLYDSFQGLPEKSSADDSRLGDNFRPGELKATKAEVVRNFAHASLPQPIIKKAWFSDLTDDDVPRQICFAYFDGDYYDSIKDSFRVCETHLAPGAVVVVDDYVNVSLPGAAKAVDEWRQRNASRIRSFRVQDSLGIITLVL